MKDKTAIINAAQKYASKGQIDKAIAEWEKLLDDRKDGNIHNTIGDLYLKKGAEREAIESFSKAAEIFRKDGFYPKAIAIYKKILNISPNDVDALIALAKLNAERGLIGNAVENYYRAAEIYNRDGATEKATMTVEKILQLSPTDVNIRAKIAYLYFRIGLRERAANEYASIASTFLEKDNFEKAKEFYDKAIEYDPECIPGLIGLSNLAKKTNNIAQAFGYLKNALSHNPDNREVLLAYARLAMDANKTDEAKKALLKVVERNASDTDSRRLLGELYLKEGELEKAWEELLPFIDNALEEEKWSEAHALLHKFRELYPIPAGQRLLRICKAQADDATYIDELKNLARLNENEGLYEDALKLYKEARELMPDDPTTSDKIRELEIKLGIAQPTMPVETVSEEDMEIVGNVVAPPETEKEDIPVPETSSEMDLIMRNDVIPPEPDEEDIPAQPQQSLSAEEFAAKKAEADFYAQQGLKDEAIKIFEELLLHSPHDEEIARKLERLKSTSTDTGEVTIEKVEEEGSSPQAGIDDDLQAIFNQFEKRAEETVDYESHYTSGLELKQKGLLDEAIKELQIAAKDPEKKLRNSTMLALCYQEKGAFPRAIAEFNKVMDLMSPSDSTYLHVKYELAKAHMNNKDLSRALELFSEVQAQAPDFKDVADKIDFLKAQTGRTQEKKIQPKRDRVSYI